ncbi:replication-relaxation family protein [Streptomyces sp. NPDC058217]|uniref:replication-relaxation family protein n=1 Tax=Streptomyces sp. NPDC058217 TaxID=3346384 RepID=UPI0036E3AAC2
MLQALGVVKVATAEQLRQLVLAGTADAQTVRNACKDLRGEGLVESVGSSSRPGKSGQPVTQQLWNLTTAGLAAAAAELDRPVREMGGTAREAAKAGAAHALRVTDTIDAFCQTPPLPTKPIARRSRTPATTGTAAPTASAPEASGAVVRVRPQGLGLLRGWETEVALPVVGTFATPGKGSLRSDAVLRAPEDGMPVLFVEVDNHTEPPVTVAKKVERYRRFFQRTVKDHRGHDAALWSTLWDDSGRGGYPPVALVFTKAVGPKAMENRMREVGRLAHPHWHGQWQDFSSGEKKDGYRNYTGTIPLLATTLSLLAAKGPHGPVWWRYGHDTWQTLNHALDNPDDIRAYRARDGERRAARETRDAEWERQRQEQLAELERQAREAAARVPDPVCGQCQGPLNGDPYSLDPREDWDEEEVPPADGQHCPDCRVELARRPKSRIGRMMRRVTDAPG